MKITDLGTKERENDFLKTRIESLNLPKNLFNILLNNNIRTIGGLIKRNDNELKGFGISNKWINIVEQKIDELLLEAIVVNNLKQKQINNDKQKNENNNLIIDTEGEDDIINFFAKSFDLSKEDIESSSRKRDIVRARDLIAYILREYGEMSFLAIGRLLGGRDHTTIIYACKKVKEEIKKNKDIENGLINLINKAKELKERRLEIEEVVIPEIFADIKNKKFYEEIKLKEIPERNNKILDLYRQGLTLENIGRLFNITRERVRQIAETTIKQIATNEAISKEIEVDTSIILDEEKKSRKIAKGVKFQTQEMKNKEQRWSKYYLSCKSCGTTTIPHVQHGLCEKCIGQFRGDRRENIIAQHQDKCDACGILRSVAMKEFKKDLYIMKNKKVLCRKCFLENSGKSLGSYKNYEWSRFYQCCISCGTTSIPYHKKGLCEKCGNKITDKKREAMINCGCKYCGLTRLEAKNKFKRDLYMTKDGDISCMRCFLKRKFKKQAEMSK